MACNIGMNPMMMGGMSPMMMGGMGFGNPMMMQMMQMMAMMQMMMGQMQGMNPMMMGQMGCGMPMGMPMGDVMGGFNGMPPNFSQPMMMPGYMPQPFMNQSPWRGGFPYQQPQYGGPQGSWSSAPMCTPGDFRGGSGFGNALARNSAACSRPMGSDGGSCYRGVKNALAPMGVHLQGGSAYQAADQLAGNPRFREVQVARDQLRNLPPGAVVVWAQGEDHPHGHISIALGNGMEGSDVLRRQITNYPSTCRVFLPNGQ